MVETLGQTKSLRSYLQTPQNQKPKSSSLESHFDNLKGQKVNAQSFEDVKALVLQDKQVDQKEAKFLMDKLSTSQFEPSVVPLVTDLLSQGYEAPAKVPSALIGKTRLTHVEALAKEFTDIKAATKITDNNGIDEVYFKDEKDKLYVAYGSEKTGGALDLRGIKEGYIGRLGKQKVTVVHINNETNTLWEGAKAPWVNTYNTLTTAGQNGIAKGIGEVATTVTALFIGKTVLEKGMKTVGTQVGSQVAAQVAEAAAGKATEAAAKTTLSTIGKARALGSSIGSTVKETLKTVAVAGAVAGAVVGTVVTIGSGIGAVRSQMSFKDYATLNMVTGKY